MKTSIFLCRECGSDISLKPSNRRSFCNSGCFAKWARKVKLNNKQEKRYCLRCGAVFEVARSIEQRFCSRSCSASHNNTGRHPSSSQIAKLKVLYAEGKLYGLKLGVEKAKKIGTKIDRLCPVCGKKYKISPWMLEHGVKKFCSKECCYKRPNQGGYHSGSVRNFQSGWYESTIAGKVWLDSSYEFVMARYLDEKGYRWKKNTNGFPYVAIDGSGHLYVPDFHIADVDLWVETKGYMTENDQRKFDAFPYRLVVITKKTIYDKSTWGF